MRIALTLANAAMAVACLLAMVGLLQADGRSIGFVSLAESGGPTTVFLATPLAAAMLAVAAVLFLANACLLPRRRDQLPAP